MSITQTVDQLAIDTIRILSTKKMEVMDYEIFH
jgi:hypothetical protein